MQKHILQGRSTGLGGPSDRISREWKGSLRSHQTDSNNGSHFRNRADRRRQRQATAVSLGLWSHNSHNGALRAMQSVSFYGPSYDLQRPAVYGHLNSTEEVHIDPSIDPALAELAAARQEDVDEETSTVSEAVAYQTSEERTEVSARVASRTRFSKKRMSAFTHALGCSTGPRRLLCTIYGKRVCSATIHPEWAWSTGQPL
jgi:hypothetical protein